MLTESLLAVAELQPLYGSVDAVRAHDRPGNKQKHNRIKNITTSKACPALSLSLSPRCSAAQNNQIITGFCHFLPTPVLPPPPRHILTNKICRLNRAVDLDVRKPQQTRAVIRNNQRNITKQWLCPRQFPSVCVQRDLWVRRFRLELKRFLRRG